MITKIKLFNFFIVIFLFVTTFKICDGMDHRKLANEKKEEDYDYDVIENYKEYHECKQSMDEKEVESLKHKNQSLLEKIKMLENEIEQKSENEKEVHYLRNVNESLLEEIGTLKKKNEQKELQDRKSKLDDKKIMEKMQNLNQNLESQIQENKIHFLDLSERFSALANEKFQLFEENLTAKQEILKLKIQMNQEGNEKDKKFIALNIKYIKLIKILRVNFSEIIYLIEMLQNNFFVGITMGNNLKEQKEKLSKLKENIFDFEIYIPN